MPGSDTDQTVLSELQAQTLEVPNGGASVTSTMWNLSDFTNSLNLAQNDWLRDSGLVVSHLGFEDPATDTGIGAVPGVEMVPMPQNLIDILRVAWIALGESGSGQATIVQSAAATITSYPSNLSLKAAPTPGNLVVIMMLTTDNSHSGDTWTPAGFTNIFSDYFAGDDNYSYANVWTRTTQVGDQASVSITSTTPHPGYNRFFSIAEVANAGAAVASDGNMTFPAGQTGALTAQTGVVLMMDCAIGLPPPTHGISPSFYSLVASAQYTENSPAFVTGAGSIPAGPITDSGAQGSGGPYLLVVLPGSPALAVTAVTDLPRDDAWSLDNLKANWETSEEAPPYEYTESVAPAQNIYLAYPPADVGQIDLFFVAVGQALSNTGVPLGVPDIGVAGVVWKALYYLFDKVGEAEDKTRSEYCYRRYEENIALCKSMLGMPYRIAAEG